jgi:mannose-6-phosphate isomerase-like protein (cupin superfamily)
MHEGVTDFYVVQAGSATLHLGGEISGSKEIEPGEHRGASLRGAKTRRLAAGDVVNIPAKLPHQITVGEDETITYMIVKIFSK